MYITTPLWQIYIDAMGFLEFIPQYCDSPWGMIEILSLGCKLICG